MTLPLAALGALIAALFESTPLAELPIAGATIDLVLILAVVATMTMGVEDGLVWAFVGGLMLDMLTPARPIGATTLTLLLVTGFAILATRFAPSGRRVLAVAAVFALTFLYHGLLLGLLNLTQHLAVNALQPRIVLIGAVLNALVAIPVAFGLTSVERRIGARERPDW